MRRHAKHGERTDQRLVQQQPTATPMPMRIADDDDVAPVFVVGGGQKYCKIVNSSMIFPNI
jgi:hypothetical protein